MRDGHKSACKACELLRNQRYYATDAAKQTLKVWCDGPGKAKRKRWALDWESRNVAKRLELNARYRTTVKSQTPVWANADKTVALYKIAEAIRKNGSLVEVDHIVPLQSAFVCGLHVHNNLQIIPKTENSGKRNRFWPDMAEGAI